MEHYYEVLFDFAAEEEGEMSIYVGEKVVATTTIGEDGWLCVSSADGASGIVPMDYLKPCEDGFDSMSESASVANETPAPNSVLAYINNTQSSAAMQPEPVPESELGPEPEPEPEASFKPPTPPVSSGFDSSSVASSSNSKLTTDMLAQEPDRSPVPTAGPTVQSAPPPQSQPQGAAPTQSVFSPYASKAPNGPGSVGSASASKLSMGSKFSLKSAAKSVATVNRAVAQLSTKTIPPAKAPTLLLSVERDNLDELVKKNGEYFSRVVASQGDTLDSVTEMVDVLTKKLGDASQVWEWCESEYSVYQCYVLQSRRIIIFPCFDCVYRARTTLCHV